MGVGSARTRSAHGPPLPGLPSSSTLIYGAAAVDIIKSHDPQKPLFLYLAFQARARHSW